MEIAPYLGIVGILFEYSSMPFLSTLCHEMTCHAFRFFRFHLDKEKEASSLFSSLKRRISLFQNPLFCEHDEQMDGEIAKKLNIEPPFLFSSRRQKFKMSILIPNCQ